MTLANVITASRLGLFVLFVYAAHQENIGLSALFFGLAWGLDALDGLVARMMGQATAFGFVFDKVVDRAVLIVGVLVLLVEGLIPLFGLWVLTKDVVLIPTMARRGFESRRLLSAGLLGRWVVLAQGIAVLWLLYRMPFGRVVVVSVALFGLAVGAWYRIKINDARR